jgi:hypothetical protein
MLNIPKDYSFSFTKFQSFDFILDENFNKFTNIIICVQAARILRHRPEIWIIDLKIGYFVVEQALAEPVTT